MTVTIPKSTGASFTTEDAMPNSSEEADAMTTPKATEAPPGGHTLCGNCWAPAAIYDCRHNHREGDGVCDVCHMHDYPRGNCEDCDRCETCDAELDRGFGVTP